MARRIGARALTLLVFAGLAALPGNDTAHAGERVGKPFRTCRGCPEMVEVPAGRFVMGSPADEPGRGVDEGPQRIVDIPRRFAIGRYEVTRGEYARFVRASHHPVLGNCITDRRRVGDWRPDAATTFRDPGYAQTDRHPVACVSWFDANAYVEWLNTRGAARYRLPTEAEWEYVARAGSSTAYPWGDRPDQGCRFMNGTDATARVKYASLSYVAEFGGCDDHALNTAPVGSYRPNAFGVYDMIGNVGEWTRDCSTKSYDSPPPDPATCPRRVVRGGSWGTVARQLRAAERVNQPAGDRDDSIGIRVVLDLRSASPRRRRACLSRRGAVARRHRSPSAHRR